MIKREKIYLRAIQNNVFADGQDGKDGRGWGWSGNYKPFMKKGWITWMYKDGCSYGTRIFIEDNVYRITFNSSAFELYKSKYHEKMLAKQEIRDEVIRQSEIKHKVTLISI